MTFLSAGCLMTIPANALIPAQMKFATAHDANMVDDDLRQ